MTSVSDRHEGDLGGQLAHWDRRRPLRVQIVLGDTASQVAVQHTAWMLVNLLARMEGVVTAVYVHGPDVPLAERVVPLAGGLANVTARVAGMTLLDALIAGGAMINIVSVVSGSSANVDIVFELGPGPASAGSIRVHGDGWAGGITAAGSVSVGRWSALPFGPYTAACLAAGLVFLGSRAPDVAAEDDLGTPLLWSTWSLRAGELELLDDGPTTVTAGLDAGLAGVGAVGASAMHTAWATRGLAGVLLAVDGDRRGVDETNLNRGVVFVRDSVGEQKAAAAARRLADGEIAFVARQGRYEEQADHPGLLLSAVDRSSARAALQARYPARVIGASTHGLRVEMLRTGPAGLGACLRCNNEPEPVDSDEELRARIRDAAAGELAAVAASAGVSVEDARHWAAAGGCGAVDSAMLRALGASGNHNDEGGEFAVAFVSAFAGTLLTAEALKDAIAADAPLSDTANRVTFQFLRPRAVKGPHFAARDEDCPACRPGPGREIWSRRREGWGPARG
jgi:hypothetical protein